VRDDDLTVGSFPPWFRRWGVGAWLVVGMALVVVAAVWLLSLTSSIVGPLIAGAVIGAVGASWSTRSSAAVGRWSPEPRS
jgi:hypothetical protein